MDKRMDGWMRVRMDGCNSVSYYMLQFQISVWGVATCGYEGEWMRGWGGC